MDLYTIILDYRGGTYISQVRESSPDDALLTWARTLDPRPIYGMGEKTKVELMDELLDDHKDGYMLVAITDTVNVWCATALLRGSIGQIHMIKTMAD